MSHQSRRRFWVEAALASLSGAVLILTLVLPDWIETVFGVDPDQHSGSLEWVITAAFGVMAIAALVLARREWERRTVSFSTTR